MGVWLKNTLPKLDGSFTDGNGTAPIKQPEEYYAGLRPYDKEVFSRLGILTQAAALGEPKHHPAGYPIWSMTWEDAPEAEVTMQRWDGVQARHLPSLVIAPADQFDSMWDAFVADMNALETFIL